MNAKQQHLDRAWLVHRIANDFKLEDVWRFDLGRHDGRGLDDLLDVVWTVVRELERARLSRVRLWIGNKLGWDTGPSLPIPGCDERTVAARLADADLARNRATPADLSPLPAAGVKTIYRFTNEALYEVSNKTIHALLHVGWIAEQSGDVSGVLAVYAKHRGVASKVYMAAIWPARHAVIYPALVKRVERGWQAKRRDTAT